MNIVEEIQCCIRSFSVYVRPVFIGSYLDRESVTCTVISKTVRFEIRARVIINGDIFSLEEKFKNLRDFLYEQNINQAVLRCSMEYKEFVT